MPSTFAHYHFGNLVLAGLPPKLQERLAYNRKLFSIGLHGPDILFHFRPVFPNRIASKGYAIHGESAYGFSGNAGGSRSWIPCGLIPRSIWKRMSTAEG